MRYRWARDLASWESYRERIIVGNRLTPLKRIDTAADSATWEKYGRTAMWADLDPIKVT
jgi:hypothetical protein